MKPLKPLLPAGVLALAVPFAVAAFAAAALAGPRPNPTTAHTARAAKIELRRTSIGTILVNSSGATLYDFTRDHGHNSCIRVSGCTEVWPALTTSSKPTAGPGVHASLLSTVKLPNGAGQVTYAGHPLYLYSPLSEPGNTSYVGASSFGGTWDALNAAGHQVH